MLKWLNAEELLFFFLIEQNIVFGKLDLLQREIL